MAAAAKANNPNRVCGRGSPRVHREVEAEGGRGKLIFHKWRLLLASDCTEAAKRGKGVAGKAR